MHDRGSCPLVKLSICTRPLRVLSLQWTSGGADYCRSALYHGRPVPPGGEKTLIRTRAVRCIPEPAPRVWCISMSYPDFVGVGVDHTGSNEFDIVFYLPGTSAGNDDAPIYLDSQERLWVGLEALALTADELKKLTKKE